MLSHLHQCVKLNKRTKDMNALQTALSRLLHRFGFAIIRIQQTRKPEPKTSKFKKVTVYDNDWND